LSRFRAGKASQKFDEHYTDLQILFPYPKMIKNIPSTGFIIPILCVLIIISVSTSFALNQASKAPGDDSENNEKLDNSVLGNNVTASSEPKHRSKRFIHLNIFGTFDVGWLIIIPVILVLPNWSNIFNVFRKRRRRSISSNQGKTINQISYSLENPAAQIQLDKVISYFNLLEVFPIIFLQFISYLKHFQKFHCILLFTKIPEEDCQIRVVCELAADPHAFLPLSNIILKRIRNPSIPTFTYSSETYGDNVNCTDPATSPKSLYWHFNDAADIGQSFGATKCKENYSPACKYDTEKLLNMPVLNFWKTLTSHLKLKFSDDLATI